MTKTERPLPDELEQQKKAFKRWKFLRALFEGKLTKRNRPVVKGYTTEKS